jgi:glycosyltransferase involved in cell wall biosynthesis
MNRSILHVASPARAGGLESVLRMLAMEQAARGHRVGVVLRVGGHDAESPLAAALEAAGVEAYVGDMPYRRYLAELRWLKRIIRLHAPEVLHTHGYRSDVFGSEVARQLRLCAVSTAHGFTGGDLKNRFFEWVQVRSLRRLDAVVAVSSALADTLVHRGVPRDRLYVVQNAWRADRLPLSRSAARRVLGWDSGAFVIGWVGRLSREKGADVFLSALQECLDLPICASVIGDGRERALLEGETVALGLSDRFRWHGHMDEAARLFPAFDLFVLSSRTEGTPIVLFEAMAAKIPIVTTSVGGVPDVLSNREALMVPPDDPRALAAAIRAAHTDIEESANRVRAASSRLSHFDTTAWVDQYDAVYAAVTDV